LAIPPPHNPPLERTAAAVYFDCGRASRVRRRGRSTALRYPAMAKRLFNVVAIVSGVIFVLVIIA